MVLIIYTKLGHSECMEGCTFELCFFLSQNWRQYTQFVLLINLKQNLRKKTKKKKRKPEGFTCDYKQTNISVNISVLPHKYHQAEKCHVGLTGKNKNTQNNSSPYEAIISYKKTNQIITKLKPIVLSADT